MSDKVRKIFDMLGVEPNEKFKCYTKDGAIVDGVGYINEELIGYQIVNGEETYVEDLLSNILNGLFTINKLSKKKHVGDKKCLDFKDCKDCPFKVIDCLEADNKKIHIYTLYDILDIWFQLYKDKELYEILKARLDKEVE